MIYFTCNIERILFRNDEINIKVNYVGNQNMDDVEQINLLIIKLSGKKLF
jgi:hypothetical protein